MLNTRNIFYSGFDIPRIACNIFFIFQLLLQYPEVCNIEIELYTNTVCVLTITSIEAMFLTTNLVAS